LDKLSPFYKNIKLYLLFGMKKIIFLEPILVKESRSLENFDIFFCSFIYYFDTDNQLSYI